LQLWQWHYSCNLAASAKNRLSLYFHFSSIILFTSV
jgi:hypothetical protein